MIIPKNTDTPNHIICLPLLPSNSVKAPASEVAEYTLAMPIHVMAINKKSAMKSILDLVSMTTIISKCSILNWD